MNTAASTVAASRLTASRLIAARRAAAALVVLLALPSAARATTPCEAPEQFVRTDKLYVRASREAAPLLRPYVIGGIAAVAVREEGGQRWLELAVHSAADARRQLADRSPGADPSAVDTWGQRVWLRCPGGASRT